MTTDDWTQRQDVSQYLRNNPRFLDSFVRDHVHAETLQRWLETSSPNKEKPCTAVVEMRAKAWQKAKPAVDKQKMLSALISALSTGSAGRMLWELSQYIIQQVPADGFLLHLPDAISGKLHYIHSCQGIDQLQRFDVETRDGRTARVTSPLSPASQAAASKKTIIIDGRLDQQTFAEQVYQGAAHILAAPFIQSDGCLVAVVELYRSAACEPFRLEDEQLLDSLFHWGGVALHYADLYHSQEKQRNLHQFLLVVVKSIFQDMISMDTLMTKIMTFTQNLVDADRASLFLVDNTTNELYARIFDMGDDMASSEKVVNEIRFPIGTGIAGQVALTGKNLNISDAYSDPRFNRNVDMKTGYRTRTILCMPILSEGAVIGVVQMVNKNRGLSFTSEDEASFELFATYCGLALHHAKLYDKIRVSEQKHRVALDVLSYHASCTEEEVDGLAIDLAAQTTPLGIDQFSFDSFLLNDLDKVRTAVFMFVDLFGLSRFDQNSLVRFCLTVRKNYRRVPYHNWTHGFAVANSMYAILKRAKNGLLTQNECLALFVGSLCHDLDHRGKNNKFMLETASPLAAIYTTSTMEHHHFNQTVTILQQDGHNIISHFDKFEYKEILDNIRHCILATDLAMFFPNRIRLADLVENHKFDWSRKEHRMLVAAVAMTASDLSASAKPWDTQAKTVEVIFQEFYEQGDAEKAAGKTPMPMMDRTQVHLQPESQVGFISSICIPCYDLLHKLIPETKPLLEGCHTNLVEWRRRAADGQ